MFQTIVEWLNTLVENHPYDEPIYSWVQLVITLAMLAWAGYSAYQAQKQMRNADSRDETMNEFRFSTSRYGAPIPVAYGRCRVGGVIVDQADFQAIKKTKSHDMGKGGSIDEVYYIYKIRQQIAVSMGSVETLEWFEIGTDTKEVNWTPERGLVYTSFDPVGPIASGRFYWGTAYPPVDSFLDNYFDHDGETPAYGCVTFAVFQYELGRSPAVPCTSYIIRRYVNLLSTPDRIGTAMNPAQIWYDLLVNGLYGHRYPTEAINQASFEALGALCVAEGLGMNIAIGPQESLDIDGAITAIKDWVDAADYEIDGKLYVTARRYDYEVGDLLEITQSDLKKKSFAITRPGYHNTYNGIYQGFKDIDRRGDRNSVFYEDSANLLKTGTARVAQHDTPVQTDVATAEKVCLRKLRNIANPLAVVTFILKDETIASQMHVYKVFKFSYSRYGIVDKVLRVTKIEKHSDRTMYVESVEEILGDHVNVSTQPTTQEPWEVAEVVYTFLAAVFENPWRGIYGTVSSDNERVSIFQDQVTYDLEATDRIGQCDANIIGTLNIDLPIGWGHDLENELQVAVGTYKSFEFPTDDLSEVAAIGGTTALQIDDEIIYIRYVSDETYGFNFTDLYRGMEGTEIAAHSSGAEVAMLVSDNSLEGEFAGLSAGDFKIVFTPGVLQSGSLTWIIADAQVVNFSFGRYLQGPLPPVNIQIGSQGFINRFYEADDITFNWRETSRDGGAGSKSPSSASAQDYIDMCTQFVIEIKTTLDVLLNTYYATNPTWEYTQAMRVIDGTDTGDFKVVLKQQYSQLSKALEFIADSVNIPGASAVITFGTYDSSTHPYIVVNGTPDILWDWEDHDDSTTADPGVITFAGGVGEREHTLKVTPMSAIKELHFDDDGITHMVGSALCTGITTIDLNNNMSVYIKHAFDFTWASALETLDVSETSITSVNVEGLKSLQTLTADTTEYLTEILLLENISLATLNIENSLIVDDIDLSQAPNLVSFNITQTDIWIADMREQTNLQTLVADTTHELQEIDVRDLTSLISVSATEAIATPLTAIRVAGCTALQDLDCSGRTNLKFLTLNTCVGLLNLTAPRTIIEELDLRACTSLVTVDVNEASLSKCYLGTHSNMTSLILDNNSLTEITLSGLDSSLVTLNLDENAITSLSLTGLTGLTTIRVRGNSLSSLTVTPCTLTTILDIGDQSISTLTGISSLTALEYFTADSTSLTALNLSSNVEMIECDVHDSVSLATLTVTNLVDMTMLNVSGTAISSLNVSTCTSLLELYVDGCSSLTSLTENTTLEQLHADGAGFTSLDFTNHASLEYIDVMNCSLTSLIIDNADEVLVLRANNNNIPALEADDIIFQLVAGGLSDGMCHLAGNNGRTSASDGAWTILGDRNWSLSI